MGLIRAAMVAAGAVTLVWPAYAAKWNITPSASVEEEFTDNLGLRKDSEDRNSDFVTTLSPGLTVRGNGGRVKLNGDFGFSELLHMQQPEFDSHRINVNTTGTAEVWEKSVFIDASAQIANQVANPQAAVSQSQANLDVNSLETTTWTIGPRFLHHFGTWVETTSVLNRTSLSTRQPNSATNAGTTPNNFGSSSGTFSGATPIGNSTINTSSFEAKSGRSFTQVLWTFTAHDITTNREDAPHHNDKLGRLDTTYVVNRQLSLNVGAGKQIIDDDAQTVSRSGPLWSVGATYHPGPRLTLTGAYNHQFEEDFFTYSGVYNISPRTTLSLNHTESVETTQQLLAQRQPVLGPDGIFRDPVTLLPTSPVVAPTGLQNDTLLQKVWNLTGTSTMGRNTYSVNVNRLESTVERTGQVTTDTGVLLSYNRQLTHLLNGGVSANYRMTKTESGAGGAAIVPIPGAGTGIGGSTATADGKSSQILLNGHFGYTLTPETTLSFTVNYSAFDGGAETFNSHEKSATIGLRRTF